VTTEVAVAEALPPDVLARIGLRNPRRQRFVEHYLLCGVAALAAQRAGYRNRRIRQTAHWLLHLPDIAAAIEAGRKALAERASFTFDRAMEQLRADRDFAIKTENATAAVRASELMAKMSGHLVERVDARVATGFIVNLRIPPAPEPSGE
jgi:phage terminase small subunit